ncbi:hypothetical protein Q760_09740 [Cellulomonas cellasea DSM 20118]|uniref:Uncharacterized protein n=1 Tax=Cellulomonas cellasea DSM 20118 TaxID=1408250 RepID=A0A0A0BA27_9CELL|nr:hypothetical protein Q760_09740 [Cellulomonas cellasea DSM 20118]
MVRAGEAMVRTALLVDRPVIVARGLLRAELGGTTV